MKHRGQYVGHFGACEVLSFHATKFINAMEGGAVVTHDSKLAAKLRLMRNFGFAGYDRVDSIGTNGKMTEVCAAMGLTSLDAFENIVATNRRNYHAYMRGLEGLPGIELIRYEAQDQPNYQYVVIEVDAATCPLSRDELVSVLHAEKVLARRYFWPGCHQMEPYRTLYPDARDDLPYTEYVAARVMVLPTGQAVDEQSIAKICEIMRVALEQASDVRLKLHEHAGR